LRFSVIVAAMITCAVPAEGQLGGSQLVTGLVIAKADESPLPHAMVTLQPAGRETFTDDRGRFSFARVPPGNYRLRVIHLGFSPTEQSLSVVVDSEITRLRVELGEVQVRLAAIHVTAEGPCVAPGAPDPLKQPEFAMIFQQLEQNAQQFRLLADSFPYAYRVARTEYSLRGDSVIEGRHVDTLLLKSNSRRWTYRAGRVVTSSILTREHLMHLPTLADFASDEFVKSHCFRYGGEEQTSDGSAVRINFRAADRLGSPDVNGTILLDATLYQIRRADLQLFKIPFELSKDVAAVSVTTLFREVEPSVLVFSNVHGKSTMIPTRNRKNYIETPEDQVLLDFSFLRADPRRGDQKP